MDLAWPILALALVAASVACAVYYAVVWARTERFARRVPSLAGALTLEPRSTPSLCVVVPAHNEEAVIGRLAASLRAQTYPGLRVVFALDRCDDGTEATLRAAIDGDERFEIVVVESCPEEWAGKVHAAHSGVTRGAGARDAELFLFTDADTWYQPGAIRAAVALLQHRELGLLSIMSTLTYGRWFEWLAQPAVGMELVRRFPLDRLNRDGRSIRFANGQFMLFDRAIYDAIGGHAGVRAELLEDLAFARAVLRPAVEARLGVLISGGAMHCEMYRTWAEFVRGWKRIFTESDRRRIGALRRNAWRQAVLGFALPTLSVLAAALGLSRGGIGWGGPMLVCGSAGVVAFAGMMWSCLRTQRAPAWVALAYPVGALASAWIQWRAGSDLAAGRGTSWGGRTYAREAE